MLFGILALQMDFVDRDRLIEAMHAWVLRKSTPLGELLEERGALSTSHRALLEGLVDAHIARHGDPKMSIRSLRPFESVRETFYPIVDADVRESLTLFPLDGGGLSRHTVRTLQPGGRAAEAGVGIGESPSGISTYSSRFTVLRPHAEGGLGRISLAHDHELNRRVAFKEIKHERHAEDPAVRARFVSEAEITGKLEHPGVVPVYSLGEDERGRPFYAMRFVRGIDFQHAIDRFHKNESEAIDRPREFLNLLRRFLDVCDVTAFAHRKGVIHRDIKPNNVLLGDYGETIVVDWGIAKLLADAAETSGEDESIRTSISGDESFGTMPGSKVGTPGYMSPEQAAGELGRVGPLSDVYSLGATLYAVLTGRPPCNDDSVEERLLKTMRGEFPRPREINPEAPGPLEAVCLKATALSPADRYASVKELAADVEKYLADEPISIYRDPPTVTIRRWARRHRTAFTASVAAALIAAIGLAATAYLQSEASRRERGLRLTAERQTLAANVARAEAVDARSQAEREAERATLEAKKAGFLSDFMIKLFQSADPIGLEGRGLRDGFESIRDLKAAQLLERGAKRVSEPSQVAGADPLAIAALSDAIGNSLRSLGEFEKAKPLIESALAVRRERLSESDSALGDSFAHIAILQHDFRDFTPAEDNYRRALQVYSKSGADPKTMSRIKFRLAWMYAEIRKIREAEVLFKEVLAETQRDEAVDDLEERAIHLGIFMLMLQNHNVVDRETVLAELSRSMPRLMNGPLAKTFLAYVQADGLRRTGAKSLAKPRYEEALRLAREFLPTGHVFLAALLADMAGFHRDSGELERAEELIREALDIGRRVMPTHPYMIEALTKYSEELSKRNRHGESERVLLEAVGYAKKRATVVPADGQWRELLARLVGMMTDRGRAAEAEAYRKRFEEGGVR